MLRRVSLVTYYVSEIHSAFVITVTRIDELGTKLLLFLLRVIQLLVTANIVYSSRCFSYDEGAMLPSETSILTEATQSNIPEVSILHSHLREIFNSCIMITHFYIARPFYRIQ
jgi:hypothetical protein